MISLDIPVQRDAARMRFVVYIPMSASSRFHLRLLSDDIASRGVFIMSAVRPERLLVQKQSAHSSLRLEEHEKYVSKVGEKEMSVSGWARQ